MREERRERTFKGIISLVILRHLWRGPSYGYEMEREVKRSLGFALSSGEIYSILRNMEIRGLVRINVQNQSGRRRRYYEISTEGRRYLIDQIQSMEYAVSFLSEILKFAREVKGETSPVEPSQPPDGEKSKQFL